MDAVKTVNLTFIKEKREERGLSLQQMAAGLGFKNASTYLKYETGEYEIKAKMLPVISRMLDCEIEDFFTLDISKIEII